MENLKKNTTLSRTVRCDADAEGEKRGGKQERRVYEISLILSALSHLKQGEKKKKKYPSQERKGKQLPAVDSFAPPEIHTKKQINSKH